MGPDSLSSTTVKGVTRTLAQHHQAVVGFLVGFFLVLLVYTTVSGQFAARSPIVFLKPSPPVHGDHGSNLSYTSPLQDNSSSTLPLGNSTSNDDQQTNDVTKKMEEELSQDRVDEASKNSVTDAKLGNSTKQEKQRKDDVTDKMEEELIRHEIDEEASKKNSTDIKLGEQTAKVEPVVPTKPICDLSDPRYDVCEMSGDARAVGANLTVFYVPPVEELGSDSQEWSIRDQSRKHLQWINKVTVKSLNASQQAPECTSRHTIPAIVFAVNGLTSNPWHDFSDVLVPLFITTRAFDGEVQFLISDLQPWFVDKYRLILKNLSRYDIINFNRDDQVRCYPHVIVGLRSHRDLGIDPARAPRNYTMLDFRMFIRDIYSLPAGIDIPYKSNNSPDKKPRLMLINRGRTRKFVNFPEIVEAIGRAGFEVLPIEPHRDRKIEEISRLVDSCDVLMGAHGAGLTNFFFLRTNALLIQVVPWGHMEYPSMAYFGGPAREMKLRDIEYSITAEESTLYDKYGKDHPVISDPESIHKQGWQLGMKYYWLEQDVRLNATRFAPILQQALQMLKE